ncbi:hypothetical protein [Leifsonia sp. 2MCAF36]|uniref:hypothetical protein n=1 Tax=Leifsonia sp. 2MCAF36 TaxID=3232988 RepID=UPI003F9CEF8C
MVIDYQNVHMTAHDVFDPRGELHASLIHPIQFAQRAIVERNERQRQGMEHAVLSRTIVFRGRHNVDHHWEQHRRCNDQAAQWQKDGAIVELRDLKYTYQLGANREPILDINGKKVPNGRPKEKGIDVLCALALVREAARPDVDVVILASRDTDLVPALDEVHDFRGADPTTYAKVETVAWFNRRFREEGSVSGGALQPTSPRRIWNTNLDRSCFEASIDRNTYR